MDEIKHIFRPEFINRIDDIIVFEALSKENMKDIIEILLAEFKKRAKEQMEINVRVADSAKVFLVDQGYDPKYGARALKRKVQSLLEDEIAEEILSGSIKRGDTVSIKHPKDSEKLVFTVAKQRKKAAEEPKKAVKEKKAKATQRN